MKRINFVFSAFLFVSVFTYFSSFAQLEQGTFIINESFDFHSSSSERTNSNDDFYSYSESSRNQFNSTTSFGYLIKENQEVGVSLKFGKGKVSQIQSFQGNSTESDYSNQTYGIGIHYKRYLNIIEKLSFFVSPQLTYSKNESDGETNSYSTDEIGANIYTGILYRPAKRFGLSMNLVGAVLNYNSRTETDLKQNWFSISDFGGLNLALQFML